MTLSSMSFFFSLLICYTSIYSVDFLCIFSTVLREISVALNKIFLNTFGKGKDVDSPFLNPPHSAILIHHTQLLRFCWMIPLSPRQSFPASPGAPPSSLSLSLLAPLAEATAMAVVGPGNAEGSSRRKTTSREVLSGGAHPLCEKLGVSLILPAAQGVVTR